MTARPFERSSDITKLIRQRQLARPTSDCLSKATPKFQKAKTLVVSRVRAIGVTDESDVRLAVLAQVYDDDLTAAQFDGVRARLDARRGR